MREFQTESQVVLTELTAVVDRLESSEAFDAASFGEFAQKVDRIMGAAETLYMIDSTHHGLKALADLARLCKGIGYKVAETKNEKLAPIVTGFWADVVEIFQNLLKNIESPEQCRQISDGFSATLKSRLEWMAQHLR